MTFGQRLRTARKNKGLTQKQLADMIHAKHNSVSDWENDKNRPDPDTIEYICGALDISASFLFSDPDTKKKNPESDASDSGTLAERLYDFLISIGYLKPGQDLTDQQLEVLSGMVTILDAVFDEGKQ